jgi:hypothetical protein
MLVFGLLTRAPVPLYTSTFCRQKGLPSKLPLEAVAGANSHTGDHGVKPHRAIKRASEQ